MDTTQLKRIADALELVIQMVKKDQEETKARFEERWDKEDNEKFFKSLKQQAANRKLQASSLTEPGPGDSNRIIKEKL